MLGMVCSLWFVSVKDGCTSVKLTNDDEEGGRKQNEPPHKQEGGRVDMLDKNIRREGEENKQATWAFFLR